MSEVDVARDPEPVRWSAAGVDLVTIPIEHYAELLRCRLALERQGSTIPRGPKLRRERGPRPSTLDVTDPAAAAFYREKFATGVSIERAMQAFYLSRRYRGPSYQRVRSLWHATKTEAGPDP